MLAKISFPAPIVLLPGDLISILLRRDSPRSCLRVFVSRASHPTSDCESHRVKLKINC